MKRRTALKLASVGGVLWVHGRAQPTGVMALSPLKIGLTAVILADQDAFLSRWSDYLGARMGVPVTFVARESYQNILDLLFSDQIDAAWICGYPYVLHQRRLQLLATHRLVGSMC